MATKSKVESIVAIGGKLNSSYSRTTSKIEKDAQVIGKKYADAARRVSAGFGKAFGAVAKYGKLAAKAATGAVVAVTGLAVKGGIDRLLAIEDAEAKFRALGVAQKDTARLMDGLKASLRGTAYAMDEGAGSLAKLFAAGRSLATLNNDFELVADAAAFSNTPLDAVADLFSKISTRGKVTTGVMQQLQTRGVPSFQLLASAAGVSVADMQAAVTRGMVSSDLFFELWEKGAKSFGKDGIIMSGAAKKMGDTTKGAFANMRAALSRFGVALVEDVFPEVKTLFNGVGQWLDEAGAKVKPFAQTFTRWIKDTAVPAVSSLASWISRNVVPAVRVLGGWIMGHLVPAVAGFVRTVRDAISGVLTRLQLWFEANREQVSQFARAVGSFLTNGIRQAGQVAAWLVNKLADLVAWVVRNRDWLSALAITIGTLVAAYKAYKVAMELAKLAQAAFNLVASANPLGLILTAITAVVAGLTWFFAKTETGRKLWARFTAFLSSAWEKVSGFFTRSWKSLVGFGQAVWGAIHDVIVQPMKRAFEFIMNNPVVQVLQGILGFVTNAFRGRWSDAWRSIVNAFTKVWGTITTIIKAPINFLIRCVNWVIDKVNWLTDKIRHIPLVGESLANVLHIPKIPELAKGGWTQGPSLAGEAGRELVISFDNAVRAANVQRWAQAGTMLGVSDTLVDQAVMGRNSGASVTVSMTIAPVVTLTSGNSRDVGQEIVDAIKARSEEIADVMADALARAERESLV